MVFKIGNPCKRCGAPEKYSNGMCVPCHRRNVKTYRTTNILKTARHRAKRKGIAFALKEEDIIIPEFCPVCSTRIESSGNKYFFQQTSDWSIDRLNNDLGYEKENIRIVCALCNRLKLDMGAKELRALSLRLAIIADYVDKNSP